MHHLGFLTIQHDQAGYSGGYLVTNTWGRPHEFRLTNTISASKVQQLLFGPTLRPHICSDLLGKTLVEKAGTPVSLVITDCDAALDLRLQLDQPVVWLAPMDHSKLFEVQTLPIVETKSYKLLAHPRFPADVQLVQSLLQQVEISDLAEPFLRVRDALTEARKMGVQKAA